MTVGAVGCTVAFYCICLFGPGCSVNPIDWRLTSLDRNPIDDPGKHLGLGLTARYGLSLQQFETNSYVPPRDLEVVADDHDAVEISIGDAIENTQEVIVVPTALGKNRLRFFAADVDEIYEFEYEVHEPRFDTFIAQAAYDVANDLRSTGEGQQMSVFAGSELQVWERYVGGERVLYGLRGFTAAGDGLSSREERNLHLGAPGSVEVRVDGTDELLAISVLDDSGIAAIELRVGGAETQVNGVDVNIRYVEQKPMLMFDGDKLTFDQEARISVGAHLLGIDSTAILGQPGSPIAASADGTVLGVVPNSEVGPTTTDTTYRSFLLEALSVGSASFELSAGEVVHTFAVEVVPNLQDEL